MKKKEQEYYHCFEAGDLCRNQDGDMFVIVSVLKWEYEFINLQSKIIRVVGDNLHIEKGSISKQPCSVFDRYNLLYLVKS